MTVSYCMSDHLGHVGLLESHLFTKSYQKMLPWNGYEVSQTCNHIINELPILRGFSRSVGAILKLLIIFKYQASVLSFEFFLQLTYASDFTLYEWVKKQVAWISLAIIRIRCCKSRNFERHSLTLEELRKGPDTRRPVFVRGMYSIN